MWDSSRGLRHTRGSSTLNGARTSSWLWPACGLSHGMLARDLKDRMTARIHASAKAVRKHRATRKEAPPAPVVAAPPAFRIGIHTSIAGGLAGAADIAQNLGCNCLQIFSASPRMWPTNSRIQEGEAQRFLERRTEIGLHPLVIHANYLINLASSEPVLRARSVQAFQGELVRALALNADFLVFHPGAAGERSRIEAIYAIAEGVHHATRGLRLENLRILFENTAGQGSSIGARLEELRGLLDLCSDLPVGVCLDTAHLLASGYDIRTPETLEETLRQVEKTVGLNTVFVMHLNDSKVALGGRSDRHEHIGKGKIGLAAFRSVLNHPLLAGRAFLLETPIDKPGDDRRNVRVLWSQVGVDARQIPGAKDGFTMYRGPKFSNRNAARAIRRSARPSPKKKPASSKR
jgi:deoxyribonuclease IV